MKLFQFEQAGGALQLGVQTAAGGGVVGIDDLVDAAGLQGERLGALQSRRITPAVSGMMRWLQLGASTRESLRGAIEQRVATATVVPLASVALRAPIGRPGKIVGIGRNYADHAAETGVAPFEKPRIIFKMPSSVSDPGGTVVRPTSVAKLDFEAELAVVIGEFVKDVPVARALDAVAGYTVLNDVSAREFQFDVSPAQTTFAKSMDGFCPLGPCLVTADEIPDPQALRVQCWVNDEPMQDASTADMLFGVRELISYISRFMTLEPGDLIATGTPAGIGAFRTPPQWLRPGDRVRAEVSGIGALLTTIG